LTIILGGGSLARPVDEKKREETKAKIMEMAREVFCKKGFINVTMTDLLEAAGMSRGGFYFYYKSVDEVFKDTVYNRKKSNFEEIRRSIEQNPDFFELLDSYFKKQKSRLLHMDDSLIRALYEYLFTHTGESDIDFRNEQKNNILETVNAILQLGIQQKAINHENIVPIAEHFMYTIEGLNVMALFQGLTGDTVDQQLEILKNMIKRG
jgi:AcrR family transcriptional regulator